MSKCVDRVAGDILAGWRYDISGIVPEMRGDYEAHFAACEHCRAKRRLHRTIDIALIFLAAASALVFLVAFVVVYHFAPRHALILEVAALAGFLLSILVSLIVAVATPAPLVMVDAALPYARRVHDRLPENIRERIPEELRVKITRA
ncbi:MAG: hypothetical protein ACE14L_02475 [Terriglobales bacterium]